jgi:signal transduction histidine kinase
MSEHQRASARHVKSSANWLVGGGEMGTLVRSRDWSATPLGPLQNWPQSLRTTVGLCLSSNFPISLVWGDSHVQIYNDGYWPICGGKHPKSMGQDFTECWASAWPAIGDAFESALAGETRFLESQRMFLDRHGYLEETFFTFSFSPIRDESGKVAGLFHPVTEMTAQIVAERRTRALRDVASGVGRAHTVRDALILAAETLAAYDFDVPFALMYGLDPSGRRAELVAQCGRMSKALAPPVVALDEPSDRSWPVGTVAATGRSLPLTDLASRFDLSFAGPYTEVPSRAILSPITLYGTARPTAVLITGISSRLPFDDPYAAFVHVLALTLASTLNSANSHEQERARAETLAELDRAKTEFFSNVSHEFRTPLTLLIRPLADELAERTQPLPADRRERLEMAHRNSLRLLKLVNTLLDFSRAEAGRADASFELTDIAAMTNDVAGGFRSAVEHAGLTFVVDCDGGPAPIYVDRDMWEKIVLNLVSNAFKHTFTGSIRVTLRPNADGVELRVADSGVGIPAPDLVHIFDRFYRVKEAKSRTHEGTGIGLALVRELVLAHSGTVEVESIEGRGTTFIVGLKSGHGHLSQGRLVSSSPDAPQARHLAGYLAEADRWSHPNVSTAGNDRGSTAAAVDTGAESTERFQEKRPHIVLADDNADMREYIRRLLVPHFEVTTAANGVEALASTRRLKPELVLSDVMMPELDGFGLLRALREDPETRTTPIVLLSARANEEASVEALDSGADDYLVKPFTARELFTRVRTHIDLARMRRAAAAKQLAVIEADNARLSEATRVRGAFLAHMSHELRTPLNAIIGFSEVMRKGLGGSLSEDHQDFVQSILDSGRHLLQLVNNLLDIAKIDADKMEFSLESVNLKRLVLETTELMAGAARDKHITLTSDVQAGPDTVVADTTRLKQVLFNFVSNAIKFTPDGGEVRVTAHHASAGGFALMVSDTGVGISEADQSELFSEFRRFRSGDANAQPGTGLGLALTKRLVEAQHGRVSVESAPGKGSTFSAVFARQQLP